VTDGTAAWIAEQVRLADVRLRLQSQAPAPRQHEFVLDLRPSSTASRVILDGNDISAALQGVDIHAEADDLTQLTLRSLAPLRIRALLPGSQCTVAVSELTMQRALEVAFRSTGVVRSLPDVKSLARNLLKALGQP